MKKCRSGSFAVRQIAKGLVDFACGFLAVGVVLAVGEERKAFGALGVLGVAIAVGVLLVVANGASGGYRTIWHYTGLREVLAFGVSSFVVVAALITARSVHLVSLSSSSILLIALGIIPLCLGVRAVRRLQSELSHRRGRTAQVSSRESHRVLIAGAGNTGLLVSRDLIQSAPRGVHLVGFVDDDTLKIGCLLNGAPVLGPLDEVEAILDTQRVSELIIAMPAADPSVVRSLVRRAEDIGVRVRAVPGIERLLAGQELYRPGTITLNELVGSPTLGREHGRVGEDDARRVLITGGAGYIGAHLTRSLLDRGYQVRILDSFAYGRSGIEEIADHPGLEIIQGDICNIRDVSYAVRDVDGVLALAAIVGDPACNLDPQETINLNYASTKILVEACNFYGVRRLVFASSCSVYGASENDALLNERSRLNPVSLYARTRVLSENIIFDRRGDVEPVVLRLATVFGLSPRMRFDLVVNTLTVRAVVEQKISIYGGSQWRPNVHCRDVVRAFVLALEAPANAVAGEIFNVGGDSNNHRIAEIGETVARLVGDVEVEMQEQVPDRRDYRVSFGKIRRVLAFEPEYSVERGIREVAAAVRHDPDLRRHHQPIFHNVHALRHRLEDRSPLGGLAGV
jgi:nucleoside-diphosphate-sugar epimerase